VLLARVASAAVLAPLILLVALQPSRPLFAVVAALAAAWCALEYCRLLEKAGLRPAWPIAAAGAAAMTIAPAAPGVPLGALAFALVALAPGVYFLAEGAPLERAAHDWAQTTLGAAFIGWPLAQAVRLRVADGSVALFDWPLVGGPCCENGALLVVAALTCTWASDTAAYAVGRVAGRRPFFARVSPRKTLEGAAAGLAGPALAALAWAGPLGWPLPFALVLGLAAGVAAICGDLLESMLKRAVGAKDAGALIPGHGGLLDRIDGLLLVLVAFALLTGQAWP
jgi:phosphatidate cytidylyltransferase